MYFHNFQQSRNSYLTKPKSTYVIELHRIIVDLIFEIVLVEGLLPGSFRLCVSRGQDQGGERFERLRTRIKIQSDEKDCYKNSSDQNRLLFSMSNHEASARLASKLCTHRRQSKRKMRDITSRFHKHFVNSTQSFSQALAIPKKKMAVR